MAYTPAGNLTSSPGLAQLQAILYKKKALDQLRTKFIFREATFKDALPLSSGRTVQWYRYNNNAASSTQTTEGSVGTSLTLSTNVVGATVTQYSSFINVSDFLKQTALDSIVQNASDQLGYRAGLSVDTMTRTVIDAESVGTNQAVQNTFLRVSDLRAARHGLQALNVEPIEGQWFLTVLHPFASYDVVNDPAAGGLADIFKYTEPDKTALVKYVDRGEIGRVAGCRVVESTNVFTQTTPNRYRTYVFGKNGIGSVDLAGNGPSDIVDPNKQRFQINTHIAPSGGSIYDPEGVIGAAVSYNFKFATVVVEGPAGIGGSYRYRTLDAESTLG